MHTLYDVLGLSRLATQHQIDLAYNQNIEALTNESNSASIEQNAIRAKAIKEAYSILSSPPRRLSYDASLRAKEQVTYQIVEKPPIPWGKITIAFLVVAACLLFYNHQQNKAEKERKALEVQQAQAKAIQAEQEALAEQTRIEQQKLYTQRQADARRNYEIERARYEGNAIVDLHRKLTHLAAQFASKTDPRLEHNPTYQSEWEIGVIDVALLGIIRRWHLRDQVSLREISKQLGYFSKYR